MEKNNIETVENKGKALLCYQLLNYSRLRIGLVNYLHAVCVHVRIKIYSVKGDFYLNPKYLI